VVRMVNKVLLDLMVRKDPREVLDHGVMPVILDLSDLLERLDLWVALGQLDNLVILDCRVCRVKWVQLGFKDPLDHRELLDHLDKLVHLDCRDLQEFQVVKDSKEPLVCDLHISLCLNCNIQLVTQLLHTYLHMGVEVSLAVGWSQLPEHIPTTPYLATTAASAPLPVTSCLLSNRTYQPDLYQSHHRYPVLMSLILSLGLHLGHLPYADYPLLHYISYQPFQTLY